MTGTWLFHTRIQYGSHDVPVPLLLTIKYQDQTVVRCSAKSCGGVDLGSI
jgi:hypothetical protein